MAKLAVIIPVYNEEANVLPLAEEVCAALADFGDPWELVFVDDGSQDATWERICEAARRWSQVRGIRHERNAGQSAALWTGFRLTQSEWIATLDGDRQNDPAELPRMLTLLREYDFVSGDRSAHRQDSWIRKVASAVARWVRQRILRSRFRDTGCGLRVFRREVLVEIPPFDGLHRFLPVLVERAGWRTLEIPVSHRPRPAGRSKYGIWDRLWRGIYDLIGVRWFLKRRIRPQRVETTDRSFST